MTQGPVRGIAGATVRAPCCMIADALTKVVMIAGEGAERLLQRYRASALLVLEFRGCLDYTGLAGCCPPCGLMIDSAGACTAFSRSCS